MGEGALARVRIRSRAEVDAAGAGLDIGGGLSLAIGKLTAAVERIDKSSRRWDAIVPVAIDFQGGATSAATGSLVLTVEPGGPPPGYIWHVRRFTVAGSLASSAPTGTIFVFRGMEPPSATAGDFGSRLVDASTTAFPTSAFYDDYQLTVAHPNKLYFIIGGAIAASTFYSITGTAKMVKDHGPGVIAYQE